MAWVQLNLQRFITLWLVGFFVDVYGLYIGYYAATARGLGGDGNSAKVEVDGNS